MNTSLNSGFALPTVIISSIIMFIVLLAGLNSVVSTGTTLDQLYLDKLSAEAQQSGAAMAAACLKANSGAPKWPNSRPLRPSTDCTGTDIVACSGDNTENPLCYISKNNGYKSRFTVTYTTTEDGKFSSINSNGIVERLRRTNGEAIERFQQSMKIDAKPETDIVREAIVSTVAGSGSPGYNNGFGSSAQFSSPYNLVVNGDNHIYVADNNNNRIRRVTAAGDVTTFAGSGTASYYDQNGTSARFFSPRGIAADSSNNLYVADGNAIRKITPSGDVTMFAGSPASGYVDDLGINARFNTVYGLTVDSNDVIYVADGNNNRIRKITQTGVVTTLAGSGSSSWGDGIGSSAHFSNPYDVATDSQGNVYVADRDNHRIRKITPAGAVTTLAGSGSASFLDGTGTSARFRYPTGISLDSENNVYIADSYNHRIRKITPSGIVTTLAGSSSAGFNNGIGSSASFNRPYGLDIDKYNTLYISDFYNHSVRKIPLPGLSTDNRSRIY